MGGLMRTYGFGVLLGGGLVGLVTLACGHLPMEQLPVDENPLTGDDDGGGNGSSSSSSSGDTTTSSSSSSSSSGGTADAEPPDPDGGLDASVPDATVSPCTGVATFPCDGYFVKADADPADPVTPDGSQEHPFRRISDAIDAHRLKHQFKNMYIAVGNYPEAPRFEDNLTYVGGFICDANPCKWRFDKRRVGTVIVAPKPEGIVIESLSSKAVFQGLEFKGFQDAATTTLFPNVTTLTIRNSGATFKEVNIAGGNVLTVGKSVALSIEGAKAGDRVAMTTCHIDATPAVTDSIGLELNALSNQGPLLFMKGGSVTAERAERSIAVHVGGGTSEQVRFEDVFITAGLSSGVANEAQSWGVVARSAGLALVGTRINTPSRLAAQPHCLGAHYCGGILSVKSKLVLQSSYVGGLPADQSVAVMLVDQAAQSAQTTIINGNTLDGGGGIFQTAAPTTRSAAIVVQGTTASAVVIGRVRNNILGSGSSQQRFNIYEEVGGEGKSAHLEKVENNAFYFSTAPGGQKTVTYRTYKGEEFGFDQYCDPLQPTPASVVPAPKLCVNQVPTFKATPGEPPVLLDLAADNGKIINGAAFDGEAGDRDIETDSRKRGTMDIGADETTAP